ncbi:MAG: S8 family serine peptidase [Candidatus Thermochlorobacter sp.]
MHTRIVFLALVLLGVFTALLPAQERTSLRADKIKALRHVSSAVPSDMMEGIVVVKLKGESATPFEVQATRAKVERGLVTLQATMRAHGLWKIEPLWKAEYENKLRQTLASRIGTGELGEAILTARTPSEAATRLCSDISRIYYLHYSDGANPTAVAAELSKLPEVEYAEPSYIYSLSFVPNDSAYGARGQDFFDYHNIPQAWEVSTGSANVVIAILDTGIEFDHPDLQDKIWTNPGETGTDAQGRDKRSNGVDDDGNGFIDDWRGWDFWESGTTTATRDNNPIDEFSGHGTGTAGLAGASTNNGIGIASTGFNCRVMAVKLGGTRDRVRNVAFIDQGIIYAAINGANIINSSFGGPNRSRAIEDAVNFATNAGALVVAASGNSGSEAPSYPAAYTNALSVGAVLHAGPNVGQRAPFSNFGATVKVYAAGSAILTTVPGRPVDVKDGRFPSELYIQLSGTSFSCPIIAGIAGLIKAHHPTWSPLRIATQIRATAFGPISLRILDADAALRRTVPGLVAFDLRYDDQSSSIIARIANYNAPTANAEFLLATAVPGVSIPTPRITRGVINTGDTITLSFQVSLPSTIDFTTTTALFRLDMVDNPSNYSDAAFLDLSRPAWLEQTRLAQFSTDFHAVKLVNRNVAWACADAGVVIRTLDGGRTWTRVAAPTSNNLYCINALSENIAIVGDGPDSGPAKLYRTTDGGQTWQEVNASGSFWNAIHFFDAQNGIAQSDAVSATDGFVLVKTTNGGASWTPISQTVSVGSGEFGLVGSFQFVGNSGWFGTNKGRVIYSTDAGNTWNSATAAGANDWLIAIAFSSPNTGVAGGYTLQNQQIANSVLRRSADGGRTWTTPTAPSALAFFSGAGVPEVGQLWLSVFSSQGPAILTSRDAGATWLVHNSTPLTDAVTSFSFVVEADTVFGLALTNDGLLLRYAQPARASSVREIGTERVQTFKLEQNYPNPFNPTTTIVYQLPVASEVSLKVYDILGREVATLFRGRQNAGRYQAQFNASQLSSGMYFYRLQAGNYVETKKMMLIK